LEKILLDAAATAFCKTVASFRNTKELALLFSGEVVVASSLFALY
jgi:hypothetical protein